MKFWFLIVFFISSHFVCAQGGSSFYIGGRSQLELSSKEKINPGFKDGDFSPPVLGVILGGESLSGSDFFSFDLELELKDTKTRFYNIMFDRNWSNFFINNFSLGFGVDVFISEFSDDSKFKNTAFENQKLGLSYNLGYKVSRLEVTGSISYMKTLDSTVSKKEGIKTKMKLERDVIYKLGVKTLFDKYNYLFELSFIEVGERRVLSKEFFYIIPSESTWKYTVGTNYNYKSLSLWLKYHAVKSLNDEYSSYYQLPNFSSSHTLSKSYVSMELTWNF